MVPARAAHSPHPSTAPSGSVPIRRMRITGRRSCTPREVRTGLRSWSSTHRISIVWRLVAVRSPRLDHANAGSWLRSIRTPGWDGCPYPCDSSPSEPTVLRFVASRACRHAGPEPCGHRYMLVRHWPGWRNGRRDGLKIHCPKGRAGSSPAPGTDAGGSEEPRGDLERPSVVTSDHGSTRPRHVTLDPPLWSKGSNTPERSP